MSLKTLLAAPKSYVSFAPGKICPETLKAPVELRASYISDPSVYNIFLPLSVVPQVTPDPPLG